MKCITCGKNEAINDFYKECRGCIERYQNEQREEGFKKALEKLRFYGVWF